MDSGCLAALGLRYMDHIRCILNKCNISTAELEQLSTDRDTWKSACASALATYNVSADQAAEDRCIRRHNPANPPTTGPRCPQCSRICASEYGLRSHLRSHASATLPAAQTSSSNSTDYCKQANNNHKCCIGQSVQCITTLQQVTANNLTCRICQRKFSVNAAMRSVL